MDLNAPLFFVGTSGWTYDHWKGRIYPDDLPKSRWFNFYAERFPAVEINATFYRNFTDHTYENWRNRAPDDFGYVLKVPRIITHRKFLVDVEEDIKNFCRSGELLEDHLEMFLLQIAPQTTYDLGKLRAALKAFTDPHKVAVEFRSKDWVNPDVEVLLRDVGATYCIVDSPRQKLSDVLTSDRAYLRLHGRKHWYSYNYPDNELAEIANLARSLADRGARRIYIFFNNDFEGYAPANAMSLLKMFTT